MVALCMAMLVDRGYLSYDDLVIKYWPEYGKNGKNNTTIEDILTHKIFFILFSKKIFFFEIFYHLCYFRFLDFSVLGIIFLLNLAYISIQF